MTVHRYQITTERKEIIINMQKNIFAGNINKTIINQQSKNTFTP